MTAVQASGAVLADRLETIMWAQVTMAVVMVVCALAILGAAIAVWLLARKAIAEVERTREQLVPHVAPLLDRAGGIADDVREITAGFRDEAQAVHAVVDDLVARSQRATESLDERVRRFALVLEAVQQQAEELLLDAASTAHGVHAAARALREGDRGVPRPEAREAEGSQQTARENT